jgi:hypothetical protein
MLNFVYLRSSRLHFLHFWLESCIVNKEEQFELVLGYWMHLEGFQVVSSHFWALVCTGLTCWGHRSDRSECWSCSHVTHRSDRWCWPVRAELMQLLCFPLVVCMHSSRGSCIGSGGACMCAGGALVRFGGLRSLLEHSFVSDVSSRCPCLRGPRLVFVKWSFSLLFFGLRSLVGVSFDPFLFFSFSLRLLYVCVVNGLIKEEIEDHAWFEDRWMVTYWCDEWLTTLCELILG